MTRRPLFALPVLLLAAALAAATHASHAHARRAPLPDEDRFVPRELAPPPRPELVAHEWGVFVLEGGRPAHLAELAAEVPPFVRRAAGAAALPAPAPPGVGPAPGTVARKPVLFLYARRPTVVRVEVGFAGGEPWLHYPGARPTPSPPGQRTPGLAWDLTVAPVRAPAPPVVDPAHWWSELRQVGGSALLSADGTSEKFLFYDGPVAFEPSFNVQHAAGGARVTPTSTERTLFLVTGGQFVEAEVDPDTRASRAVTMGGMPALRARLQQALMQRGLSLAEAESLLGTWRDELFADPRARAVYFVPRPAYDRMLPIRITPTPGELVRVGLVIDRG